MKMITRKLINYKQSVFFFNFFNKKKSKYKGYSTATAIKYLLISYYYT
jgi:hypothetical protein